MPSYREVVPVINYEIPDDLHRQAKAAAALRGISLKEFLITALEQLVAEDQRPKQS